MKRREEGIQVESLQELDGWIDQPRISCSLLLFVWITIKGTFYLPMKKKGFVGHSTDNCSDHEGRRTIKPRQSDKKDKWAFTSSVHRWNEISNNFLLAGFENWIQMTVNKSSGNKSICSSPHRVSSFASCGHHQQFADKATLTHLSRICYNLLTAALLELDLFYYSSTLFLSPFMQSPTSSLATATDPNLSPDCPLLPSHPSLSMDDYSVSSTEAHPK